MQCCGRISSQAVNGLWLVAEKGRRIYHRDVPRERRSRCGSLDADRGLRVGRGPTLVLVASPSGWGADARLEQLA
jgi:hypothetical protein